MQCRRRAPQLMYAQVFWILNIPELKKVVKHTATHEIKMEHGTPLGCLY